MKSGQGQKAKWANPRGPKFLRDVIAQLFDELNRRTVLEGLGFFVEQTESGRIGSVLPSSGRNAAPGAAAATDPDISFFLSDASVTEGDPPVESNKILVNAGKVNGEFPDGLGTEDYIIDVADPADCLVYVLVTFDPDTLEILSRQVGASTAAAFPDDGIGVVEDGVGQFAQLLGFTYFDSDDDFRIHQVYLGDINFKIIYGQNGGVASALAIPCFSDWMDIPDP